MKLFSNYSDLRPNLDKCEVAGIGVLKGVNWALCGLKSVDLTQQTIKILGMHFSYELKLRDEKNFTATVVKIQKLLRVWCQRSLTLEGKITIFKTLAISKIVYIAYLSSVPNFVIKELKKIQNEFLWNGKRAKIKHETLSNSFETGGLQSVDIEVKIKALQLSWINRLFDQKEHQWKIIPRFLLQKNYGEVNVFYPHFAPSKESLKSLPIFYQNIFTSWRSCSSSPISPVGILNQRIWHNFYLKIENKPFFFKDLAQRNINYVYQLFNPDGSIKTWNNFRLEFGLENRHHFKFLQLVNTIPPDWRQIVRQDAPMEGNYTQGLLQCTKIIPIEKLVSRQIYSILIRNRNHSPTSKAYFNEKFQDIQNDWLKIYTLPRKITKNAYDRVFQYKIINNTLYLNKKNCLSLVNRKVAYAPFVQTLDEDPEHLFFACPHTIALWTGLQDALSPNIMLENLNAKSALLGFIDAAPSDSIRLNHILLLFKIYLYQRRIAKTLQLEGLLGKIGEVAKLECSLSQFGTPTYERYNEKWRPFNLLNPP